MPQPCAVVIFGATGDLTHRKLVPALYNLAADGALPPAVSVVGFARRDKSDEVFRKELEEAARKFSRQPINDQLWAGFASSLFYHRCEFDVIEGYESLAPASRSWIPAVGHAVTTSIILRPTRTSFQSFWKTCAKAA